MDGDDRVSRGIYLAACKCALTFARYHRSRKLNGKRKLAFVSGGKKYENRGTIRATIRETSTPSHALRTVNGEEGGRGRDINHGDLRAPVKKGNAIFIVISRAVTYNKLNFYINALTSKGLMAGTDFNYRYRFIANTY